MNHTHKNMKKIMAIVFICVLTIMCNWSMQKASASSNQELTIYMLPNSSRNFKISDAEGKVKWRSSNPKKVKVNQKGKVSVKKNGTANIYATYRRKGITYIYTYHIYTLGKEFDKNELNFISKKTVNKYKKAYKKKSTKGLKKSEKKVYKGLKKALDSTKGCKNKAQKELAIHDWIIENTVYTQARVTDPYHLPTNYSYVGVFTKGKAVCEGFSQAFKLCMDILGIPCEYVAGYDSHNLISPHLWNRVKLEDGKWYQVDVTYDNPTSDTTGKSGEDGAVLYNYFNCTDAQMKDHVYAKTRKCKGTKYGVKNILKSTFVSTQKEWYDAVKSAAVQGKKTIRIFKEKNYRIFENDYLLPMYTGKNISGITLETPMYVMRSEVTPGNKEYHYCTYKIQYANNNNAEKITYIDSAAQFEQLIQNSVAAGKTKISNVVFPTKSNISYGEYYTNEAVIYDLTGKHILLGGFTTIVDMPTFMNKAGGTYVYRGDIVLNYSKVNDVVNVPKTIDEFVSVLETTITNRQKSVIIYGKGLDYEALTSAILSWEGKHQDHSIYRAITYHDPIGQFEFVHPERGVVAKPLWYEFEFLY